MNKLFLYVIFFNTLGLSASPGCLRNKSAINHYERCACRCNRLISDHNKCLDCNHYHHATESLIMTNAYEEYKEFIQKKSHTYTHSRQEIQAFERYVHVHIAADRT